MKFEQNSQFSSSERVLRDTTEEEDKLMEPEEITKVIGGENVKMLKGIAKLIGGENVKLVKRAALFGLIVASNSENREALTHLWRKFVRKLANEQKILPR